MVRQSVLKKVIRDHGDIPANLVDLQEHLGGIPFERIGLNPPPGTAVEEDLWRWKMCELVDGMIIVKPSGWRKGLLKTELLMEIMEWQRQHDRGGQVFPGVGHRFPNGNIRVPDLTFFSARTWAGRPIDDSLVDFPADLVVEFQSPENTPREMQRKLREHLDFGVPEVWIVDITERGVWVTREGEPESRWLGPADSLTLHTVQPEFRLSIGDWFAEVDGKFKHGN